MNGTIVRASKFMSLVLRHRPDKIGLSLDANGWARIDDLIRCSELADISLSRDLIHEVVATNDKKRFVLSDDGQRIRAAQGHSVTVDLDLPRQEPPTYLFHGTATRFVASIREKGLLHGNRHHVHLSSEEETGITVGQRHGTPVVLVIRAGAMWENGIAFFRSENGVWLTEYVAPEYIQFPDNNPTRAPIRSE